MHGPLNAKFKTEYNIINSPRDEIGIKTVSRVLQTYWLKTCNIQSCDVISFNLRSRLYRKYVISKNLPFPTSLILEN